MKADPSNFIPTSDSNAEEWIEWHKALQRYFSDEEANMQFLRFWNQRAGAGTPADTYALRSYMEDQGVDLTTTFSGEVTDSVMGVFGWVGNTIEWIKGILIGAVILALAVIAFWVIMKAVKGKPMVEANTAAMLPAAGGASSMFQLKPFVP